MVRRDFLSRTSLGLAAALTAGVAHEARGSTSTSTTTKRDLIVANAFDVTTLDPHGSSLTSDWQVAFNIFDTLVRRHPDGTLHPALASGWKRTAPTTWQFTLRTDVRWHDGTRFTSVDAKYSVDRTFDPSVKAARLLGPWWGQGLDRTEAPDPATLIIHTQWPDLLVPARLASCAGGMVPWALAIAARRSADERARADAYRKMTAIFLQENPWIVVLQPVEEYGLRRYVEFTPSPDQQFDLRPSNFRFRRA